MDRLTFLTAVSAKDWNAEPPHWTTAAIAGRLGGSVAETETALRQAEGEGLVFEVLDESATSRTSIGSSGGSQTPVGRNSTGSKTSISGGTPKNC